MKRRLALITAVGIFTAAVVLANDKPPQPGPEHKKLGIWVGEWTYEFTAQPSPFGPGGKFVGKQTAQPILSGFFVEFNGEEKGPHGTLQWREIDGYDAPNQCYRWNWFGNDGTVFNATYTIDGNTVPFSGTNIIKGKPYPCRGTIIFNPDFSTSVQKMEMNIDGKTWTPFWEGRYVKTKARPAAASAGQEKVAQAQPGSPRPAPELKKLDVWNGDWTYEGDAQESPLGSAGKFSGKLAVRWVLNGFCQEWKTVEKSAFGDITTVELDWYGPATQSYHYQGFQDNGNSYTGTLIFSDNLMRIFSVNKVKGIRYHVRGVNIIAVDGMSVNFKTEISTDSKTWRPLAVVQYTKVSPLTANAEQELINLEKAWAEAVVTRDLTFLERNLGEEYTFVDAEGTVMTKTQQLAQMSSGEYVTTSAVNDAVKVRVYGEVAVVTGLWTEKSHFKGKDYSGKYPWTDT
ncbi:MAG: DUF1579 family protein [Verrucomicrobiia bacterium]